MFDYWLNRICVGFGIISVAFGGLAPVNYSQICWGMIGLTLGLVGLVLE